MFSNENLNHTVKINKNHCHYYKKRSIKASTGNPPSLSSAFFPQARGGSVVCPLSSPSEDPVGRRLSSPLRKTPLAVVSAGARGVLRRMPQLPARRAAHLAARLLSGSCTSAAHTSAGPVATVADDAVDAPRRREAARWVAGAPFCGTVWLGSGATA